MFHVYYWERSSLKPAYVCVYTYNAIRTHVRHAEISFSKSKFNSIGFQNHAPFAAFLRESQELLCYKVICFL